MTIELVYNTTDTMAVVDPDGRSIGGREWGTVETQEPAVRALLDRGDLVRADEDSARENNLPAVAALDERRERAEAAKQLDVKQLREAVGNDDASKAELVRSASADPSVDLEPSKTESPSKPAAKSGRSSASAN